MILKSLSHEELDQRLQSLVTKEKELLSEILYHIAEVDRRKLYLQMAYPNLFEYLTKRLGYANGSAQRRIDAARLIGISPDLPVKLQSGELNLSQIACVEQSLRQKKRENIVVTSDKKRELLARLAGKDAVQTQKIVAEALDLQVHQKTKIQHQRDESVRLEVTFSSEQWQKLVQMRELLSTSLPDGSWEQVLTYVAEKVISQKKLPARMSGQKIAAEASEEKTTKSSNSIELKSKTMIATKSCDQRTSQVNEISANRPLRIAKSVHQNKRKLILQRDRCCQYKDPQTQRQCGSRWNLQVDHIQPQWAGGHHGDENLRILCANHNRYLYRRQAGIKNRHSFE